MKILIKEFGVTLQGEATITGNVTFQQNISVLEDVYVSGNLFINGAPVPSIDTLDIAGAATFNYVSINNLSLTGNATFANLLSISSLSVSNDVSITGNLELAGDLTSSTITSDILTINTNAYIGGTFLVDDATTFNNEMTVVGVATFSDNVNILGDINIASNLFLEGSLIVNTDIDIGGVVTFNDFVHCMNDLLTEGNLTVLSNGIFESLNVVQNIQIGSTMNVSGNTIIQSSLLVEDSSIFNNSLDVLGEALFGSTFQVEGESVLNNHLIVSGISTFNDTLIANSNTIVGGTFYVADSTLLNDDLYVSGKTTFNNSVRTNSNAYIGGTFYVSGGTTMNSDLYVLGKATFTSQLTTANATFQSNVQIGRLFVNNNSTIGGTFLVQGGTTFSSSVYFATSTTFNSFAYFSSNATFGSNVSIHQLQITGTFLSTAPSTFAAPLYISGTTTFNSSSIAMSGLVQISGGLVVTGNSTFTNVNTNSIQIYNTQTTPDIVTFVSLDNTTTTFTSTFGTNRYIASTYTLNTVSITGMSVNNTVNALSIDSNNNVYLGGDFTTQNRIAFASNGTSLQAIAGGLDNTVRAIKALTGTRGNIIAGGAFVASFNGNIGNYVAFYTGANAQWRGFTNLSSNATFNAQVYSIISNKNEDIWIGATGTAVGATANINRLGKWHTSSNANNEIINRGGSINGSIMSLLIDGYGSLYVGGKGITIAPDGSTGYNNIMVSKDVDSYNIIDFRPGSWNNMDGGLGNANTGVLCMAVDSQNNIYAGGDFTTMNNTASTSCNYIAKWNGEKWSRLGNGPGSTVNTIAIDLNDVIYVGTTNGIYRWNGRSWVTLASTNGSVNSLAFDGNTQQYLYVGGNFTNFTNTTRYTRVLPPYKTISIANTVYDQSVGNSVLNIVLKDVGENVTINATGTFGFITSKSNNLKINYN